MNDMNDIENESISKALEEALKSFDSKTKQVPAGYFDQFEMERSVAWAYSRCN